VIALPDWVPPGVAEDAAKLSGWDEKTARVVDRLTSDSRMRKVWSELLKRRRRPEGGYAHPSQGRLTEDVGEEQRQDLALRQVFYMAVLLLNLAPEALREAELDKRCEPLAAAKQQLYQAAELVKRLDLGTEGDRHALQRLADECSFRLQSYRRIEFPIVDRHRSNAETVGYVVGLANTLRELFGKTLICTVATVASVALDQEVSVKLVRTALNPRISRC
jgi:hypothetical protein